MTDIYTRVPVNKSAGIVTSQKDCSDEFLNNWKQKLRVLGLRKAELANELSELKSELGIAHVKGAKFPPKVLRHYKCKHLIRLRTEIIEVEQMIVDCKKEKPLEVNLFSDRFMNLCKQNYPDVYKSLLDTLHGR